MVVPVTINLPESKISATDFGFFNLIISALNFFGLYCAFLINKAICVKFNSQPELANKFNSQPELAKATILFIFILHLLSKGNVSYFVLLRANALSSLLSSFNKLFFS